jgi:hypothetical protein
MMLEMPSAFARAVSSGLMMGVLKGIVKVDLLVI